MKLITAILLCLTCQVAVGQGPDSLIAWYDQYKTECWADSSYGFYYKWGGGWIEYDPSPHIRYTDGVLDEPQKEWVHREPTFDGFMQYLRRKQ